MLIMSVVVGPLETNCYITGDEVTREVFIIDPGADYRKIQDIIKQHRLRPTSIINTHGHGDHIGADGFFGLPVWLHRLDADFLKDPSKNLLPALNVSLEIQTPIRLLEDGDILKIGKFSLEVIHTPGHTPGSICLKGDGFIFTGDTLFCGGVGRTDLPYGSEKDLIRSIKEKLFILEGDYIVYPGHGPITTIQSEMKTWS